MSARVGWAAAVALFVAAAVLLAAGHVVAAAVLLMGVTYLAGRWDRHRDRQATAAELAAKDARVAALEDELTYRYGVETDGRWADDSRLMPDNGGYYSPAAVHDHKADTVTPSSGVAARTRAISNP
ncbi:MULTISPECIES: hypothetical protein [unclassified Micromonospora]|uniref:hypothetical protein n=1 Tax=unclassified Micromonospora TaxID=2617518 RepID=UPI00331B0A5A